MNGLKHGRPRRESDIVRATDIYEVAILTEYEDADGPYQDISKAVEVEPEERVWAQRRGCSDSCCEHVDCELSGAGTSVRYEAHRAPRASSPA